jgi:periplasmic divalent cation tolerance protein
MPVLLVLCTCPDPASADALANTLVEARLAACVNVLPGLRSVYRWEGRIQRDNETLLLIKTTAARFDAFKDFIVKSHPNTLPEILAFGAIAGLDRYLDWVQAETTPAAEPCA